MSISLDPEKTLKLVRYDYLNRTVVPGQILFAGSSLMEQFPVHEFQLGAGLSSLIYNRGIGGFTTAEMLEHMETCVYALRPARIFLNIGTNDMNPDSLCTEGKSVDLDPDPFPWEKRSFETLHCIHRPQILISEL